MLKLEDGLLHCTHLLLLAVIIRYEQICHELEGLEPPPFSFDVLNYMLQQHPFVLVLLGRSSGLVVEN